MMRLDRFIIAGAFAAAALTASTGALSNVAAQTIPPKGADATFDVATWNIEQFGSTSNGPSDEAEQLANARRVIEESDIDLWSIQEIEDEDHFDDLVAALGPDYEGTYGGASTNLKMGFIYKRDVVDPIQVADSWLLQFRDAFAGRPPLLMLADITLPDTTVELYLVSLHMKCCGDGYAQRDEAAERLKIKLDFQSADPFILLGDFNDELTRSISGSNPSPYTRFLEDGQPYRFTSLGLEENDEETWCGNLSCTSGSNLDHILITDELFDAYIDGSTDRYDELLSAIDGYVANTSDHLPVFASFSFSTDTAIETPAAGRFRLDSIHPNPTTGEAFLSYSLDVPGPVLVEIIDPLGRRVNTMVDAFRAAGLHRDAIDLGGQPAGIYFLRLTVADRREARPLIVTK